MPQSIDIPLLGLTEISWVPSRRREPVTVGIPVPRGLAPEESALGLTVESAAWPIQTRVLERWTDGTIKWVLVDTVVDSVAGRACPPVLTVGTPRSAPVGGRLQVASTPAGAEVSTDRLKITLRTGGSFPFSSVELDGRSVIDSARSGLMVDFGAGPVRCVTTEVVVHDAGLLRAELEVRGELAASDSPMKFRAKVELFAGTATVRLRLTLHNPRRASHPGGRWVLGDAGSILFRSSQLVLAVAGSVRAARCAVEPGAALTDVTVPYRILQESSGGEHWNAPVHRDRDGRVPWRFRGFEIQSGGEARIEGRATPIASVEAAAGRMALAVPQFWQRFPQAIAIDESGLRVEIFPDTGHRHELQGGEQRTQTVLVAFGEDGISDPPLAWAHDPVRLHPSPEWCSESGVMPYVVPARADSNASYLALVDEALDPGAGFFAKREAADEFGWRNFGDLPADHESAFQKDGRRLVSHYNNQYDAIAAFAAHFLRTADPRWWVLMDDLARHVRDVDIYHTQEDKAAYNGGLFWHTAHYTDAGLSTHRAYPLEGPESGGPAAENNYNAGLMWHYFMTGERESRDAAVDLARWVIAMDDGRQTPFRWLAGGATGLASATGSLSYHGPGRAPGNSIRACLVGYQLTGDAVYLAKAEELIRRCVHPSQDLESLTLLDVERRWFYTVFLQALGAYLQLKAEYGQRDEAFAYARASLLHFAEWMTVHERPYFDRPEVLEFPTETWPAQDLRKAEVFLWAAVHTSPAQKSERASFVERARFFTEQSLTTLATLPTRRFTRPTVLVLAMGVRLSGLLGAAESGSTIGGGPADTPGWPAVRFEAQKLRAIRRFKWLSAMAGIAVLAACVMLVLGAR
jgi:hypothetical protein